MFSLEKMGLYEVVPKPNVELSKRSSPFCTCVFCPYCLSRWAFWCHVIHSDADGKTSSFPYFFTLHFSREWLSYFLASVSFMLKPHQSSNASLLACHRGGLLVSVLSSFNDHTEQLLLYCQLANAKRKYGMLLDRRNVLFWFVTL